MPADPNPKHYWFKRRRYGWGWVPVTAEGWYTFIITVGPVVAYAVGMPKHPSNRQAIQLIVLMILGLAILLAAMFMMGPKPHWRWGKKDTDNPDEDF